MKYEGPISACCKRGHNSTPKNVALTQENVALDALYGPAFKTRILFFL